MDYSALSDYLETEVLNMTLRNTAYVPTANVYVALFTGDPLDDGSGPEVSGGSYARIAVSTAGGWSAPAAGPITGTLMSSNVAAVTFVAASAGWGTVTYVAIFDQLAGGNLLFKGPLEASKAVVNGDNFKFEIGSLKIMVA